MSPHLCARVRASLVALVTLALAAAVALQVLGEGPARAEEGVGARIYAIGGPVTVRVLESESAFTSELSLVQPVRSLIGTNRDAGRTVELGAFAASLELVFAIRVLETGDVFRTGPGNQNEDQLPHAQVVSVAYGTAQVRVGFEDLFGGGDGDFNDVIFTVHGVTTSPALNVRIDVKPGSASNPVNTRSRGVLPVALLSSRSLDATKVPVASVCFGAATDPARRDCTEAHGRGHARDVNGDQRADLMLHSDTRQTGIRRGDTQACLTGSTRGGVRFAACDRIRAR